MPEHTPIEKVIQSAKEKTDVRLDRDELRILADERDGLRERAETDLTTKEDLRHLRTTIEQSRTKELNDKTWENTDDMEREEHLKEVERQIDALARAKEDAEEKPEVSDILPPEVAAKNNWKKRIASMLGFASFIKFFVNIRKMLTQNPVEKYVLQHAEEQYEKLLGPTEVRKELNDYVQRKKIPLTIADGGEDRIAYAKLKLDYQSMLEREITGKSPEQQKLVLEQHPFNTFVTDSFVGYLAKYDIEEDWPAATTTLQGIVQRKKPRIDTVDAPAETSDTTA